MLKLINFLLKWTDWNDQGRNGTMRRLLAKTEK